MAEESIERAVGPVTLRVSSDAGFLTRSAGDERSWGRVYDLSGQYNPTSAHAVECSDGTDTRSCVVLASGGASRVHDASLAVAGGVAYLAVGNLVVGIRVPSLDVAWHAHVDDVTCLGVHFHPDAQCLVAHGDLAISRLGLDGKVAWRFSGDDSFSGGCELRGDTVVATDASGKRYTLSVATGRPSGP